MRKVLILLPVLLAASPAFAQTAPPAAPPPTLELPRVLTDPALADKLANSMQALSDALLSLPAGEVRAAIEGRRPTAAERRMTVGDMARGEDPNFDRDVQRRIAQARPMVRQSMKAVNDALPAIDQALRQAGKALERVAANMPDPTYPKR